MGELFILALSFTLAVKYTIAAPYGDEESPDNAEHHTI